MPQISTHEPQALKKQSKGHLHVDKGGVRSVLRMCYDLSVNATNDPKSRLAQMKLKVEELENRFSADPVTLKDIMNNKEKEECEDTIHKIRIRGLDYIAEAIENEKRTKLQPKKASRRYDFMEALEFNLKNVRKADDIRGEAFHSRRKLEIPDKIDQVMNTRGHVVNIGELNKDFSRNVKSYIGEISALQAGIASSFVTSSSKESVLNELYSAAQRGDCEIVTKIIKDNPTLVDHEFSVTNFIRT
eukprot:TRINITY_DN4894_c0_g1_i1.p2 TRINITY_DN4894_c0_g1~~TRINITY_DN4894_c0_g1_i1.p2  ORF type:complete len:245 (+),score=62.14 TRINITY_DN4894_c0_g1_i1:1249-1983(+)